MKGVSLINLTIVVLLIVIDECFTLLYQNQVNWDKYGTGPYPVSMARSDLGTVTGWIDSRSRTSNGSLRITLEKDVIKDEGGVQANILVPDGTAYELDFDVKFHSAFDWSRGGKVGFGLKIGNGNTGCRVPYDGAGGSLRMMWYQDNQGRVYFRPYVYYVGMPGPCGDNFGKSYPSTGSLQKGKWYSVHMYVKSNTGTNSNGRVQIKINGEILIDQSIRWTTNDSKRFINKVSFATFRGGSENYWASSTDGFIYYDNFRVKQLA